MKYLAFLLSALMILIVVPSVYAQPEQATTNPLVGEWSLDSLDIFAGDGTFFFSVSVVNKLRLEANGEFSMSDSSLAQGVFLSLITSNLSRKDQQKFDALPSMLLDELDRLKKVYNVDQSKNLLELKFLDDLDQDVMTVAFNYSLLGNTQSAGYLVLSSDFMSLMGPSLPESVISADTRDLWRKIIVRLIYTNRTP